MTLTGVRRWPLRVAGGTAAAVAVVVGGLVLAGCGDDSGPEAASAASTTVGASSTTAAPADLSPEQVARDFLDAYGAFDAERALSYLTEDAITTGAGSTGNSWGSPDAFRSEVSLARAWHVQQTVTGCEQEGSAGDGVTVRCAFDYHALRSDEIGRGPFGDNQWDLVVRDGKITSAVSTWAYLTNGFSAEMWQPFQAWVSSAHPEDVQALYPVGEPTPSAEMIRLWDERTGEWVASLKAGSE